MTRPFNPGCSHGGVIVDQLETRKVTTGLILFALPHSKAIW
jgi:hypothetical protein